MFLFETWTSWIVVAAAGFLAWTVYGIIWRLYLSPIAAFPGPKIAALTRWYECYYDLTNGRGNYIWKIQEMHEKYGPIVRINPVELHIKDPDFYDTIYASTPHRRHKYKFWAKSPEADHATGFTESHDVHKMRRDAFAPFFSKRNTTILEPEINMKVEKFCQRLDQYVLEKRPVNLTVALLAFTMDVITEYSFEKSYGLMDQEDFNEKWRDTILSIVQALIVIRHFQWFAKLVGFLPESFAEKLLPDVSQLREWKLSIRAEVIKVLSYEGRYAKPKEEKKTVFEALRDSEKLPPQEKVLGRLADEGSILLIAGSEAPAKTMALIYYHLLNNPAKLQRLRDELKLLTPEDLTLQSKLEQLPYLVAVIHEGLRMHGGIVGRSQRVAEEPLEFREWIIPAGTPMAMSSVFMHYDEEIFPGSHSFIPERWLENTSEGPKLNQSLKKYLVAFGHGTRSCLGYNLGYSMLYHNIAAVVLRFDMELFETDEDNVKILHDWTIPMQKIGSPGVRALIKQRL